MRSLAVSYTRSTGGEHDSNYSSKVGAPHLQCRSFVDHFERDKIFFDPYKTIVRPMNDAAKSIRLCFSPFRSNMTLVTANCGMLKNVRADFLHCLVFTCSCSSP